MCILSWFSIKIIINLMTYTVRPQNHYLVTLSKLNLYRNYKTFSRRHSELLLSITNPLCINHTKLWFTAGCWRTVRFDDNTFSNLYLDNRWYLFWTSKLLFTPELIFVFIYEQLKHYTIFDDFFVRLTI